MKPSEEQITDLIVGIGSDENANLMYEVQLILRQSKNKITCEKAGEMTKDLSGDVVKRALVSNSNTVALLSFVISIIGFFVPLIVAFGLLGRGTSSTSAALGSVFSSKKSNKNQILSFVKNKRKLKRRKETELQERSGTSEEMVEAFSDRKCFFINFIFFRTGTL